MDEEKYFVRPFAKTDFAAWARLDALVNPEFVYTAEEQQQWEQQYATPGLVDEKWLVEERATGQVVGSASLAHSPFSFEPRKFWVSAVVHPDHRRRGIGRSLAALLDSEAGLHQATHLWAAVRRDDARSLGFAQRLGFREQRRLWMSTLDLARPDLPTQSTRTKPSTLQGIRFTTLAAEGPEREEVRRRLYELLIEASKDVPRMGKFTPISYAQFEASFTNPAFLPEGTFLAADGEIYVGMTDFERSLGQPDSLRVGFTGTRAAYRGRGIASELKRRALDYARAMGIRYLRTVNDSLNMRIWAINEGQGFVRTVEWVDHERTLVPPSEASAPRAPS